MKLPHSLVNAGYLCIVAAVALPGCAVQESPAIETLRNLVQGTMLPLPSGSAPHLNPRFQYLRVQYNSHPHVYMVLGNIDQYEGQAVQTWYSAEGEVIKLRDGRIVGTAGLPHNWLNVRYSNLPPWNELSSGKSAIFSRQRDSRTGYTYNTIDSVQAVRNDSPRTQEPIAGAATTLPDTVWWVTETTTALPAAYIGLQPTASGPQWVYTYQCLSSQACISMQPWPPAYKRP